MHRKILFTQAVILCGGYGTRLSPLTNDNPKPMIEVDKEPFLNHLVTQCKLNGINNFLFLCGYKMDKIKEYFGDGSFINVKIKYHYNPPSVETLKRLTDAKHLIRENFLLMYADNYSDLNLHMIEKEFKYLNSNFMITICKKKNGNILLDKKNKKIKKYFFKKQKKSNYVEIGYMLIKKKILPSKIKNKKLSLNYFINQQVIKKKVNYFFNQNNYLSISDLYRLKKTREFFDNQFLLADRDGVLNKKNEKHFYVRSLKELKINRDIINLYGSHLKKLPIICITNQAGIATKDLTLKNLYLINNKIKKFFKKYNINIIDFFISKSHFKSKNQDRKPGCGLFLKAVKKYKFILNRTIYIGDDLRDIEAAYNAKCQCLYIGQEKINETDKKKYEYTLLR